MTSSVKAQAVAELKARIAKFNSELEYLESSPADLRVDEAVAAYQNAHPDLKLTYAEAMNRVLATDPTLAKEYGQGTNKEFAEAHPHQEFQVRG